MNFFRLTRPQGAVLVYGAGVLIAQVLILRELLVLAQGQELKLALGLWCWLWWTGLGALLGGRRRGELYVRPPAQGEPQVRPYEDVSALDGLLTLLGLLLPATLLALRVAPGWAGVAGVQSLPLGTGLLLFLVLLAPFCLISGYFFPCACRALAAAAGGGAPGRVYALETLGAALGILLLQIFLLSRFGGLALGLATGLVLALSSAVLIPPRSWRGRAAHLAVLLLAVALSFLPELENLSRRWQWPGRQVVATADSPYALLSVSREDGQVSFFANNLWQFTYPDPFTAEHQVQLGLLAHPHPRRVLLLGGGVGLLPEILKTRSIMHLDYVELDPRLVDLARDLLPGAGAWLRDPRVHLSHQDARHFVAGSPGGYDVILMTLPEPRSAQLNRFYSLEFFRLVAEKMAPGGVFNFALSGSATSLHPWRAAYLALAYRTLQAAFPEVLALPGERMQFFGAAGLGVLAAAAPEVRAARLRTRGLKLQYVREYYLKDDLAPEKVAYLKQVLDRQPPALNTDLTPGCYFYDLALGGIQEGLPLGRVLLALKDLPRWQPWVLLGLASLILAAALRRRPGARCLYQVMVMGLGTMALEILVLVLYQIHLGSLYRQLGLLIAVFMAGMGIGAAAGGAWAGAGEGRRALLAPSLAALQILLGLLALFLATFLSHNPLAALAVPEYLVQAGFALTLAVAGIGGGAIFALSTTLWVRERGESGAKGGRLYAADLLGSTLGTLGFSFLVVPVWGIWTALILVAAMHAGAAATLLVRS